MTQKKKKKTTNFLKWKARKTFGALLEEEVGHVLRSVSLSVCPSLCLSNSLSTSSVFHVCLSLTPPLDSLFVYFSISLTTSSPHMQPNVLVNSTLSRHAFPDLFSFCSCRILGFFTSKWHFCEFCRVTRRCICAQYWIEGACLRAGRGVRVCNVFLRDWWRFMIWWQSTSTPTQDRVMLQGPF